jgi:hypothetical protein
VGAPIDAEFAIAVGWGWDSVLPLSRRELDQMRRRSRDFRQQFVDGFPGKRPVPQQRVVSPKPSSTSSVPKIYPKAHELVDVVEVDAIPGTVRSKAFELCLTGGHFQS